MRRAPLSADERREDLRGAIRRIDRDLAQPAPAHRRWNDVAGRTCVFTLATFDAAGDVARDVLGGRTSDVYASLYVTAKVHGLDAGPVGEALMQRWSEAPWERRANDAVVAIARFRRHPDAEHTRLRTIFADATTTPYATLEAGEIERLFAQTPEGDAALARLRRTQTERRRAKSRGPKHRHHEQVRSIEATTAEGEQRLCEIARHGDKLARTRALRSLVLTGRGHEAFRHVATHSTEYLPVRLSLHGLGRSDDPSDHDLLLRTVIARLDGIAHLACLAGLAGVEPICPDAYADDLPPARTT
jgi:hypothetical protein